MMRIALRIGFLGTAMIALASPARPAAVLTFDLALTSQDDHAATFDVALSYSPDTPSDAIDALQIGVVGSADALTSNGSDFSRFSFALDAATLPGFAELAPIDASGVGLYFDLAGTGIGLSPASTIHLGVLTVDLTGLGPGTYTVSLLGPPGLGSDAAGTVGGVAVDSFAAADPSLAVVVFAQPNGVGVTIGAVVPEPISLVLLGVGMSALAARARFRPSPG